MKKEKTSGKIFTSCDLGLRLPLEYYNKKSKRRGPRWPQMAHLSTYVSMSYIKQSFYKIYIKFIGHI